MESRGQINSILIGVESYTLSLIRCEIQIFGFPVPKQDFACYIDFVPIHC